jgi:hypothetical protein
MTISKELLPLFPADEHGVHTAKVVRVSKGDVTLAIDPDMSPKEGPLAAFGALKSIVIAFDSKKHDVAAGDSLLLSVNAAAGEVEVNVKRSPRKDTTTDGRTSMSVIERY